MKETDFITLQAFGNLAPQFTVFERANPQPTTPMYSYDDEDKRWNSQRRGKGERFFFIVAALSYVAGLAFLLPPLFAYAWHWWR